MWGKFYYEVFHLFNIANQGHSKGILSVTLEVLITNCQTSFQSQLFGVKFLFFEKIYLSESEENRCYECASLVLVIECNPENDDLFEV